MGDKSCDLTLPSVHVALRSLHRRGAQIRSGDGSRDTEVFSLLYKYWDSGQPQQIITQRYWYSLNPFMFGSRLDIGGWAPAWQDRSVPTGQKAMRGGGEGGLGTNRWLLFTAFFHSPHLHQRSGFEEPIPSWQDVWSEAFMPIYTECAKTQHRRTWKYLDWIIEWRWNV